jgi:hypothetical protein
MSNGDFCESYFSLRVIYFQKADKGVTMNRVPYRRFRQSGQSYHEQHDEETGVIGETLILQGIISGILLVAVMLINIITFAPVVPVQNALHQALSGPATVRELATDARQFGADVLGWQWLE